MKILKALLVTTLIVGLFYSCEKDDFCTLTPVTPNLIIRFYDRTETDVTKEALLLSVIAEDKTDSLYTSEDADSIAIPLNTLATETVYILKKNEVDGFETNNQYMQFTVSYTPEDDYVSRSCGYRVIFNEVSAEMAGYSTSTEAWASEFSIEEESITSETNAHIYIYH